MLAIVFNQAMEPINFLAISAHVLGVNSRVSGDKPDDLEIE
jgi:hypothetical protein